MSTLIIHQTTNIDYEIFIELKIRNSQLLKLQEQILKF